MTPKNARRELGCASPQARGDKDLVLAAVRLHPLSCGYAGEDLRADQEFLLAAMRLEPFVFQCAAAELLHSDDFVQQAVAHVTFVLDGICLGSSAVPVLRTHPVASSSPMAGSRLGLENYWRRQQPFLARAHWQQTSFCDVIPRSQKCSITYTPTEAQSIHMHSQHSSAADADQVPALRGHGQAARPGRHGAHQRSRSFRKQSHTLCKLSFKLENNPEHAAHAAGLREQILRRLNPRCSRTT